MTSPVEKPSSSALVEDINVREVESPSAIYKNIPKHKNAPYVAGLEPERYDQLTRLNHDHDDNDGNNNDDIDPMLRNLDPNAKYYYASTKMLGFLILLCSLALFGVWSYTYNQDVRLVPTDQIDVQSSYQAAGLEEEKSKQKKNKKSKKKGFSQQTAPPAVGLWHNFEFGLDKVRSTETLKAFAVLDQNDVFEWLRHPIAIDAFYQCFVCFVMTVVSLAIAKAIPAFLIFTCVGFAFLAWVATLGDLVIVGNTLMCFDTTSAAPLVKATGCSFPMIMHAFCTNAKWGCLTIATALLIVSVRLRGGFYTGAFKKWINITVCSGLPVCGFALYFYLWYTGLDIVPEAVGPEHGWMLSHREELIAMAFNVYVWTQIFVWFLFGWALISQKHLVVLEEDKSNSNTSEEEEGKENSQQEETLENASSSIDEGEGKRNWKKGSKVREDLQNAAKSKNDTKKEQDEKEEQEVVSDKKND